jgi:hypothetical protein
MEVYSHGDVPHVDDRTLGRDAIATAIEESVRAYVQALPVITRTPDTFLKAETALSTLATGMLRNATGTGVASVDADGANGALLRMSDGLPGWLAPCGESNLLQMVGSAPVLFTNPADGLKGR